jgi:hypothetical protein
VTTTTITEETELFGKVSASRYAKNLLQMDYNSQGEQSEIRFRQSESVSVGAQEAQVRVSQRGSARGPGQSQSAWESKRPKPESVSVGAQ